MNQEDRYTTLNYSRVGINLLPLHYQFLRELANTKFNRNMSDAIHYLLSKYQKHLYEIRITPYKRTETANYQPETKQYKRYSIWINPTFWSKLFDSRRYIGYSISAILRILLDWEMQAMGRNIIPLIPLPELSLEPVDDIQSHEDFQITENYVYFKTADYEPRRIFSVFWDSFY